MYVSARENCLRCQSNSISFNQTYSTPTSTAVVVVIRPAAQCYAKFNVQINISSLSPTVHALVLFSHLSPRDQVM